VLLAELLVAARARSYATFMVGSRSTLRGERSFFMACRGSSSKRSIRRSSDRSRDRRFATAWRVHALAGIAMLASRELLANSSVPGDALERATSAGANASFVEPQGRPSAKQAIQDGLVWLARHQSADGAWELETLKQRCTPGKPCGVELPKHEFTSHYDEGITGLAILCFVRDGYGPEAKHELIDPMSQRHYVTGEVVTRALEWLKKDQKENGAYQHDSKIFMYNVDIATLAMIECAATSKNDAWKESAQRAVDLIERAQRPSPSGEGLWGWRYGSRVEVEAQVGAHPKDDKAKAELCDSDTSLTAWSAAALSAAQNAGLKVAKESLDGAIDFCNYVSLTDGRVGYMSPDQAGMAVTGFNDQFLYHPPVMSALGMVIRLYANKDRKHPFFELAAQRIVQDLPTVTADKLSIDYYYWYQASLALNRFDGELSAAKTKKKYSGPWDKALTPVLIDLQDRTKNACSNGGWIVPDRWCYAGGPIYTTAMAVLALEACNPK
jgi:hypothetical protein